MTVKVFDFPRLHHFFAEHSSELMDALGAVASAGETEIFKSRFVWALIEYKYPTVKQQVIRVLFVPYLMFLTAFSYYSLIHFEFAEDSYDELGHAATFYLIEGILIKLSMVSLILYFVANEMQ